MKNIKIEYFQKYLILIKGEKNLLQRLEVKDGLEILDLKAQQTEHQENLPKVLLEKNLQYGFN